MRKHALCVILLLLVAPSPGAERALCDGELVFTPPPGVEKNREDGYVSYLQRFEKPGILVSWMIGQSSVPRPRDPATLMREGLSVVDTARSVGIEASADGAAVLGPLASLVIVTQRPPRFPEARRVYVADYVSMSHQCRFQVELLFDRATGLSAEQTAAVDATVQRCLASVRTPDGGHPFGATPVAAAIAALSAERR